VDQTQSSERIKKIFENMIADYEDSKCFNVTCSLLIFLFPNFRKMCVLFVSPYFSTMQAASMLPWSLGLCPCNQDVSASWSLGMDVDLHWSRNTSARLLRLQVVNIIITLVHKIRTFVW